MCEAASMQGLPVSLLIVGFAKENVLPDGPGEHPGLLVGVADTARKADLARGVGQLAQEAAQD